MSGNSLWLVGKNNMGICYAKVLKSINREFVLISRQKCEENNPMIKYAQKRLSGGIDFLLERNKCPSSAIIAVNLENLYQVANKLIKSGCKSILLEKPGSLNRQNLLNLNELAKKNKSEVFIAYNRRFFSSVKLLRSLIAKEGGIQSINFEFTEWSKNILSHNYSDKVLKRWIINNSSHVIDLVFHLAGFPKLGNYKFWHKGCLDWHPSSIFCGAGITERDIPFSYNANWSSAGRWGIEVLTKKNKYFLKPMEKLQKMSVNSVEINNLDIEDKFDIDFKPGIYSQCQAFLNEDKKYLCDIKSQIKSWDFYCEIGGYS